jgi:hypothetical protein
VTDKKQRTADDILDAIDRMEALEDFEDVKAMSDEEIAQEIRAAGGDPEAIGRQGAALAKRLLERRRRLLAWEERALGVIERARTAPEAMSTAVAADARSRLDAARADRRYASWIAAALGDRGPAACSDQEVVALAGELDELERIFAETEAAP